MEEEQQEQLEQQEQQSKAEKLLYSLIDLLFAIWDECTNWWNIGILSMQITLLQRKQYAKDLKVEEYNKTQQDLEKLYAKEEELQKKSFAYTPHFLFMLVFALFVYGLIYLNPVKRLLPNNNHSYIAFNGQFGRVRDLPFSGHSVITSAKWFNGKLYIGGDGGLTELDAVTGIATQTKGLPADFYVRDLQIVNKKLYIAGFSGIYSLSKEGIDNFFSSEVSELPLINAISVISDKNLLIGTIGSGLAKCNKNKLTYTPDTKNRTVTAFGKQKNQLWLMCEDEVLTGDGEHFKPLTLQLLVGKRLMCMETGKKSVYIGTNKGIIAGFSDTNSESWTMLSSEKPSQINDIVVGAGDILFIGSEEGVYRFNNGKMDCVSVVPCRALDVNEKYLAAVNRNSVMLFEFSALPNMEPIPELGTYTPDLPIIINQPQTTYRFEPYHDFGVMESDGKTPLATSEIASETAQNNSAFKDYVKLPAELQKPVFSDVINIGDEYILATQNRGLWKYKNGEWESIESKISNGTAKFYQCASDTYVYGNNTGIFKINATQTEMLVQPDDTKELCSVIVENDALYMLFNNGIIKQQNASGTYEFSKIPEDLSEKYFAMWKFGDKLLVLSDKGILNKSNSESWSLVYLKDNIDTTKVIDATKSEANGIFVVMSDGRILEYKNDKFAFAGVVPEKPIAMNHSTFLWVASKESLFILKSDEENETEGKSFVRIPIYAEGVVIGAFVAENKNEVIIFTDSGVKLIQISQDK